VCATSTKSRRASISASIDFYAIGVSSITSASLRNAGRCFGMVVERERRFASVGDMARPASPLQLMKLSSALAAHALHPYA
jgi:hypothetical protein